MVKLSLDNIGWSSTTFDAKPVENGSLFVSPLHFVFACSISDESTAYILAPYSKHTPSKMPYTTPNQKKLGQYGKRK